MSNPLSWGVNPSGYIKPLALDASGNLLVSPGWTLSGANVLLVDAAGRAIVQGYGGNILDGYKDRIALYHEDLNLIAGVNTYNFPAVPAGEIQVLTGCWFRYSVLIAALQIRFSLNDGVNDYVFINQLAPAANQGYSYQTNITFKAGDNLRIVATAAAVGNDWFISALGYSTNVP
jgi:hypothetical protein